MAWMPVGWAQEDPAGQEKRVTSAGKRDDVWCKGKGSCGLREGEEGKMMMCQTWPLLLLLLLLLAVGLVRSCWYQRGKTLES